MLGKAQRRARCFPVDPRPLTAISNVGDVLRSLTQHASVPQHNGGGPFRQTRRELRGRVAEHLPFRRTAERIAQIGHRIGQHPTIHDLPRAARIQHLLEKLDPDGYRFVVLVLPQQYRLQTQQSFPLLQQIRFIPRTVAKERIKKFQGPPPFPLGRNP